MKKATKSWAQNGYFYLDEVETYVQQVARPVRSFIQLDAGNECERILSFCNLIIVRACITWNLENVRP
jgi:hypothetical protein